MKALIKIAAGNLEKSFGKYDTKAATEFYMELEKMGLIPEVKLLDRRCTKALAYFNLAIEMEKK